MTYEECVENLDDDAIVRIVNNKTKEMLIAFYDGNMVLCSEEYRSVTYTDVLPQWNREDMTITV